MADLLDEIMKRQDMEDDSEGRCPACGGLLTIIYPSKRTEKGAFYSCGDDTCKNYRKYLRGVE